MKDISAIDKLERAVRADPPLVRELGDRIEEQLASDEAAERLDAGRALRAAADHDPELVVPYRDTFVEFLVGDSDSLRLSGAVGLAELAAVDRDAVRPEVPLLVETFEETVAPTIQEAVLRALTRVGRDDPASVAAADPAIGARYPDAVLPVQTAIVKLFDDVVTAAPAQFPETVDAYVTVLERDDGAIGRFTADTLARVAVTDAEALPDQERVLERVEELEAKFTADPRPNVGADVAEAAETLRNLGIGDASG